MKVSICISTWNRATKLCKIINLLENQNFPQEEFEIIVSDSHSTDNTENIMTDLMRKYNNIKHIHINNIISEKRNNAMKQAQGDVIVLLDDDVYPMPNFIQSHYDANLNNNKYVFCGKIEFPEEKITSSNYYNFRNQQHKISEQEKNNLNFSKIVTMNMSFPKSFLEYFGLMNENYICYGCEDVDYGYKITQKGFILKYLPSAYGIHDEDSSDIIKYGEKLYKTGLYGSRIFKQECYEGWRKIYSKKVKFGKILSLNIIKKKIERDLIRNDKNLKKYNYFKYKLYIYCCFLSGVRDQKRYRKLSIEDSKKGL